jgi:hypothetical protein
VTPKRVQRSRAAGWKMPPGTIYVGRPSRWGNPFGPYQTRHLIASEISLETEFPMRVAVLCWSLEECLAWYRIYCGSIRRLYANSYDPGDPRGEWLGPLRGKNLACWCPLDRPCHADVLLELANQ